MLPNPYGISLELRSNCAGKTNWKQRRSHFEPNSSAIETNNTLLESGQTNKTSIDTGLWNWGGVPFGFTLNKSGILSPFDDENNDVWTPSI
jgi:hypothetical protein